MSNIVLSLRIHHPEMKIESIAQIIDITPRVSWNVGDIRVTPKGNTLDGRRTSSYWSARLPVDLGKSFEDNLHETFQRIEKYKTFFEKIVNTGGCVEVFVGWFLTENDGFVLDAEMLRKFGNLCVSISVNGYSKGHD